MDRDGQLPALRERAGVLEQLSGQSVAVVSETWNGTLGTITGITGFILVAEAFIVHNPRLMAATLALGMAVALAYVAVSAFWRAQQAIDDATAAGARELERARAEVLALFDEMPLERRDRWLETFRDVQALMKDEQAKAIGDDLAIRMRDLNAAWKRALAENGRSDPAAINAEAAAATFALTDGAIAAHRELDARIRAGDDARSPDVARRFAQTARAVAGIATHPTALPPPSASASLQRLIGLAESALAVDPDLTDDAGARLDDLVRRHLPRLLERHATAARAEGAVDLAAVDAELARGVEQVRASVGEALARDARNRFDALRAEVAFLQARREG